LGAASRDYGISVLEQISPRLLERSFQLLEGRGGADEDPDLWVAIFNFGVCLGDGCPEVLASNQLLPLLLGRLVGDMLAGAAEEAQGSRSAAAPVQQREAALAGLRFMSQLTKWLVAAAGSDGGAVGSGAGEKNLPRKSSQSNPLPLLEKPKRQPSLEARRALAAAVIRWLNGEGGGAGAGGEALVVGLLRCASGAMPSWMIDPLADSLHTLQWTLGVTEAEQGLGFVQTLHMALANPFLPVRFPRHILIEYCQR
jgi:hypothetical protein